MKTRTRSIIQSLARTFAALLVAGFFIGAQAASLTWDGNGATAPNPAGGSGTWDVSNLPNWWDGAANVIWPYSTGSEDAVFDITAGTVTIAPGGVTAHNLTFNANGYNIAGDTLTLDGTAPTITLGSGITNTISAPVAGFSGLIKAGLGTLTLTGTNTFGGGITINPGSGVVIAAVHTNRSGISSGDAVIGAGSTLQLNNLNTVNVTPVIGNAITGSGLLRLNFAAGTTARNTSMTNLGGFTGTIELANAGATSDKWTAAAYNLSGAAVQINSGSQLFTGAAGTLTFRSISVIGNGNGENRGAIRVSNGSGVLAGPISLLGNASFGLEAVGATISGNISGTAAAGSTNTLTVGTASSPGAGTLSGVLSDGPGGGKLGLTKANGGGPLTLTAHSTYSGPTTITAGRLNGLPGASCSNSVVIVNSTAGCILSIPVTDTTKQWACGGLVLPGALGAVEFDFGYTTVPSTTLAPVFVNGNVAFTNANLQVKAAALPLAPPAASYPLMTWTGTASGTIPTTATLPPHVVGNLSLSGDGKTLILNVTQNNQQPLTWNAATASAPWDINISPNWKDALGVPGQFYLQPAAPGDNVIFDDSLATPGPLTVTVPAAVSPTSFTVNNPTKNYTIIGSGAVSGATGLTKSGAGTLMLATPNSYTGPTVINAGTVIISNSTAFGTAASGTTLNSGATIDFGGPSTTNGINLGTEVLTITGTGVGNNGALVNNNTNIGAVQINAAQRVVLAGNSSFGGITRWDMRATGNTLNMAGFNLTKTGTNYVALVGTVVTNPGSITVAQGSLNFQTTPLNLNGSSANNVTVQGGAALGLYQIANSPLWSLTLNDNSTLWAESGSGVQNTWLGPVGIEGAVTLNAGAVMAIAGDISGNGSITKIGTSTTTLSGINTYNGGTIITNGILIANNDSALGSGTVTIKSNAVRLVVNDSFTLANNIVIENGSGVAGRGLIENGALGTATLSGGTITINGGVGAGGLFASTGGGILDIFDPISSSVPVSFRTGTGIFRGGGFYTNFLVTGTVKLGANNGLSTSAIVDVGTSGAGTLNLSGYSQQLVGLTRNSAANASTVLNDGSGGTGNSVLTLTGTSAYSGIISDAGYDGAWIALVVDGGNLALSGDNTYLGPTTISAGGTLQIGTGGNAGLIGSGPVINHGTLIFNRFDSLTNANAISGSGALVKEGPGIWSLTGLNSYSGPTTVSNGTLSVRTDASGGGTYAVRDSRALAVTLVAAGGSLSVGGLEFGNFSRLAFDLTAAPGDVTTPVVNDSGNLAMNGVVAVDVSGSGFSPLGTSVLLTYAGTRSGSGAFVGGNLPVVPGYTVRIVDDVANKRVLLAVTLPSNELQWIGNLNNNWNSTDYNWVLFGTATPTNFVTYDSTRFDDAAAGTGLVSVNIPLAVIPGSVTVSNETRDYVLTGSAIGLGANLLKQGGARLTLANDNTYVGLTTISNGIVQVGNGGTTGSLGAGPVVNEATLVYNRSDSITNTVAIGGAGTVIQAGSGTLTLAVANTHAGGTTITNGTVNAAAADALSTGGVTISGNGTVNAAVTNGLGIGPVTIDGTGTLNLTSPQVADIAYSGLGTSMSGSGTVNVTLGTNTQTVLLNGNNAGFTGRLNIGTNAVAGAGKVQLNSAVDPAATVDVLDHATLYVSTAVNQPAAVKLLGGDPGEALGQLRLEGGAEWSGPVTIAGNITSTNDGTVGANSGSGTISGSIGETGGSKPLIKVGGGNIVLSGNNTYTGGTTNKGGILTVNSAAALGTGPVTITTNATRLVINDEVTVANNIIISGGGVAGRGLIENSGAGNATLSGGTVTITGPLAGGGHFASAGGGTLTVAAPISSETNTVSKRAGVVIFSGAGSYTNFAADAGTTRLGAHNGLSTSATVDIGQSAAADFDLAGFNQSLAGIKRTSGQTAIITNSSTANNSVLTLTGVSTYPGLIRDANVDKSRISLVVDGGNLTLGGANTYSGGTTISNSSVVTASTNALGIGGVINQGTLNLISGPTAGGADITYSGLSTSLSGTGVVNVALGTGTGTSRLNGNNSGFTGILNIGTNGVTGAPAVNGSGKAQLNGALGAAALVNLLSNSTVYISTAVTQAASIVLYGGDPGEDYGQLRLEGNSIWAGSVTLAGDITTANDGFLGSNSGDNRISGNITETGGAKAVKKLRAGTIALSGNNSYSGLTTVVAGALRVESPTALGTTAAGTEVANGASLQIQGGVTVTGEALTIVGEGAGSAGALRNITNDNTWAANIVVATNALTRIASDTNLLTIASITLSNAPAEQLVLQGPGDITVSGPITGPSGVTSSSTGAGVRTLAGANTYSGPTLINGGTLRVTGSLASPSVTGTGGTLAGTGTLAGSVSIGTNAAINPGVASALNETLTINNTLALAGTCLVQIGKSGTTAVNDQIVGVTDVTYGGTLVVTNMDGSALAAGDVFTLFLASGAKTGNFTNLVLLPANASLTLAFDPSTGQLTLGSAAPPALGYANTGSGLTFTWTESGFKLQAQTNTLNVGLSTNWFDYPGGAASPVTVPYDAAQGSVFFRLIKP